MAARFKRKSILFFVAIALSVLVYFFLPNEIPEAGKRVCVVFVLALFFWGFEIIPLYATSLVLIVLLTFLLTKPGGVLGLGRTGYQLFLIPFSNPVIMLFLGGFVLAEAIRKHRIDVILMKKVLARVGTRSHFIILGFLFMSAFFSMWISNTAATAMMLVLIKPVLSSISSGDPAKKGIVLATAFGANIGGIATPIGTPPNAIAMAILADYGIQIDFISWLMMGIPLAFIVLCITAAILFFFFPPQKRHISYQLLDVQSLTKEGKWVLMIGALVIFSWLTTPLHHIPESIIALSAVAIFSAFRLITAKEIKLIDWDILILMWGGLALGEAMQESGLIESFIKLPFFLKHGYSLFLSFSILSLALSSFISNTATANLLIPVAVSFTTVDKSVIALTVALACSFALALPISNPPNAMAYSTGVLKTKDMFKSGGLISIVALVLILLGFHFVIPLIFKPGLCEKLLLPVILSI